jgi:hypothetical protein
MKYGVKDAEQLSRFALVNILESIVDNCVLRSEKDYSPFSTQVTNILVRNKLVGFGKAKHMERPDLEHISQIEFETRDKCCLHCMYAYESENADGLWKMYCSKQHNGEMVRSCQVCDCYKEYENPYNIEETQKEVRIIIAGSYDFDDYESFKRDIMNILFNIEMTKDIKTGIGLDGTSDERSKIKFITSGRGASCLAEKFARDFGYETIKFLADWDGLGNRAGYVRNRDMVDFASEGNNYGMLIVFNDGESKLADQIIEYAEACGLDIEVIQVESVVGQEDKWQG